MGKPKKIPKPKKPYAGFPLWWHPSCYWTKKFSGKNVYFGSRNGTWQEALDHYNRDKEALHLGQDPSDFRDGYSIADLCDDFLNDKQMSLDNGTLVESTYQGYEFICDLLESFFNAKRKVTSLTTGDFDRLRTHIGKLKNGKDASPTYIDNQVRGTKVVFNYAMKADKIDTQIKFGTQFKLEPRSKSRKYKAKKPSKLFGVNHLKQVLESANDNPQMFAMIMISINCGFGPADVGNLRLSHLDLVNRWHDSGRNKTGIYRRCRLWSETVKTLKAWLEFRDEKQAKRIANKSTVVDQFEENSDFVFLTRNGRSWYTGKSGETPVSVAFKKLKPPASLTFNCFRHSFRTIAGESCDKEAVNLTMGHTPPKDIGENTYVHSVSDKRLKKVSKIVRKHYKAAFAK